MAAPVTQDELLQKIIEEQSTLREITLEVEKVLHYYQEHPQYPMDYEKVRQKVVEMFSVINKVTTDIQSLQERVQHTAKKKSAVEPSHPHAKSD